MNAAELVCPDAPHPAAFEPTSKLADRIAQTIALTILFAVPALFCLHAACVYDPDIWWHLRTGQWIVQHHAVPYTDSFSSTTAGKPWQAYSWLFETIVFQLFTKLGLIGIVAYSTTMVLATTAALHHLIKRRQRDFSIALLLTLLASFCLTHLHTPRPWHFTILFFILALDILLHARRTGHLRELLWLPAIFALWANLHIQFIDGLLVLGIALAESIAARWLPQVETRLKPVAIVAVSAACLLATLANPYGWRLYPAAYDLATQPGVLNGINELKAIPFRSAPDFILLALALGACAGLARARKLPLFETALFILAAYLSFHSQRDVWVMAAVAAAILAGVIPGSEKARDCLPSLAMPLAIAGASLALSVGVRTMGLTDASLHEQLAGTLPVNAAEFIQQHGYRGPVYNNFTWGGYLIWSLPNNPVSIDGRAALHGDAQIDRSEHTFTGKPDWASDPTLRAAGIVVADVDAPLTQLLRTDPHFQLTYEDKLAALFIPR